MGYQTVMRVPRIHTYNEAMRLLNKTKPIKGRSPELYPLGDRRDCDTYSIRKNIWNENIELVLYQTPVIKFTPEDEVIIGFGRWSSASTCQFIGRVLSVGSNRVRGDVVLTFVSGKSVVVREYEELALVKDEHGRWQPKNAKKEFDYRVNRKGANAVRKRVSQFKAYLSGMLKLKTESITHNAGTYYETTSERVSFTFGEMCEVLGTKRRGQNGWGTPDDAVTPNMDLMGFITEKPNISLAPEYADNYNQMWDRYEANTARFYELIRDDQDDNCRHQNYWIALVGLFCNAVNSRSYYAIGFSDDMSKCVYADVSTMEKLFDKILLTMFSEEAFTRYELADGKVPSGKYDLMVMQRKGI